jgi:hypothetical protein
MNTEDKNIRFEMSQAAMPESPKCGIVISDTINPCSPEKDCRGFLFLSLVFDAGPILDCKARSPELNRFYVTTKIPFYCILRFQGKNLDGEVRRQKWREGFSYTFPK